MGQIHRVVLSSQVNLSGEADLIDGIAAVVTAARRNNGPSGVTSSLAVHAGCFLQVIEGSEPAIEAVLARMRTDERHRDLVILHSGAAEERVFPGEAMVLTGHSAEGRRAFEDLAAGCRGDLARVDPRALIATLRDTAAQERAVPSAAKSTHTPLDTDRLRSGLGLSRHAPSLDGEHVLLPEHGAMDAIMAVAVFSPQGATIRANANYCALLGRSAEEIVGLSYEALIAPEDLERLRRLWTSMAEGETVAIHHRGLRRDGGEVWLDSTFRPRLDADGGLLDIVEIARDQTDQQLLRANDRGQIRAINAFQAVIHFDLKGTVLDANALFLDAMGYSLDEVRGRPHRMFMDEAQSNSEAYLTFWADLAAGHHRSGEFRRVGKDGRAVSLQATYNPITDMGGRPFKIVTYATVVTDAKMRQADFEWQIAAIHKSHAVITFDLNGIILDANDEFLETVCYRLEEIVGSHYRMFVDPAYARTGPNTPPSGGRFRKAAIRSASSSGSAGTDAKSGCRPPTTRSSTWTAVPSRS